MRSGLGDEWSNTQHPLLRLLSTTRSGTANTSQCGNRGNAHGVAEDDSPQRTSPLHSSFEGSPSSPRAAPARRPSPASASAARWPPDRRLLGVRHTRSPAALTQTRTDRPAHDARLGGQPVTGVRVVLLLRTVSAVCRSPHPTLRLPFSSRMKGHALKQSNAMVISPSCPPPQDAPPSAAGTASGTARQSSFSATESGDTPRRWGQGGVQQGEETGSASRVSSALTTAEEQSAHHVQCRSTHDLNATDGIMLF